MSLAISKARMDITPSGMTEMGGYGTASSPRLATGTYSPLLAKALVVWDPNPHVIVSLDVLSIPPVWHQALRPRLAGLATWSTSDIVLTCTHTHNGPMTLSHPDPWITYGATNLTNCQSYWAELADAVVDLVTDALNGPQLPVTADYLTTTQGWSASRTQPYTYTENIVPVLTFRDALGQPKAVLFGYGCHAVTAGMQSRWDGDYPSAACSAIEGVIPDCHAQFIPGSGGDQDPPWPRSLRVRDKLGAQLGSAVVTAITPLGRPLVGSITSSLTSVNVPLAVPANPTERLARKNEYQARLDVPGPYLDYPSYLRHAPLAIERINANTDESVLNLPIQVWKLGSPLLRMLFMGGEPVSGFGMWARDPVRGWGGSSGLFFGGYANEVPCYVVGGTFFQPVDSNGSYEGAWNGDHPLIVGESGCNYNMTWHFKSGAGVGSSEKVILDALTLLLA